MLVHTHNKQMAGKTIIKTNKQSNKWQVKLTGSLETKTGRQTKGAVISKKCSHLLTASSEFSGQEENSAGCKTKNG